MEPAECYACVLVFRGGRCNGKWVREIFNVCLSTIFTENFLPDFRLILRFSCIALGIQLDKRHTYLNICIVNIGNTETWSSVLCAQNGLTSKSKTIISNILFNAKAKIIQSIKQLIKNIPIEFQSNRRSNLAIHINGKHNSFVPFYLNPIRMWMCVFEHGCQPNDTQHQLTASTTT